MATNGSRPPDGRTPASSEEETLAMDAAPTNGERATRGGSDEETVAMGESFREPGTVRAPLAPDADQTLAMEPASEGEETVVVTRLPQTRAALRAAGEQRAAEPTYELLGELGRGAMGEVFVARDRKLLHKVAFKRMTAELEYNEALAQRFFAEAQITAQLDHPNIVPIYGLEVSPDGSLGYAMKFVQGKTLGEVIEEDREAAADGSERAERRRLAARLDVFLKVCEAMSFAHDKGVLHRDLKPENIMVSEYGGVYVMDWGICRLLGRPEEGSEGDVTLSGPGGDGKAFHGNTHYGAVIGTPAYMSPEQAQGKVPELDRRSDLYTLGLILYELLALRRARRPGRGAVEAAGRGEVEPLAHHHPKLAIATELEAIVGTASAVRVADRYASVRELANDIRAYLRGDPVSARPDTPLQAAGRWIANHKQAALGIIGALLLIGSAATIGVLLHAERELAQAKLHDQRMDAFLLHASRHSHEIDGYFSALEKQLLRLVGSVEEVLARRDVGEQRVYLSDAFEAGGAAPPDLTASAFYGQPISVDFPVLRLPPGVAEEAVRGDLDRLNHLRGAFADLMLWTGQLTLESLDRGAFRDVLAKDGLPVVRVFATLENGVHASYPGHGGHRRAHDSRQDSAYTQSLGKQGIQWSKPFENEDGVLAIVASTAVLDADGAFLGVTGIELTFDWIAENLLRLPGAAYVEASYLVDGDGNIVLDSVGGAAWEERSVDGQDGAAMELEALPFEALRAALGEGRPGEMSVAVDGAAKAVAFIPIYALGWSYVVVADEAELLETDTEP